MQAVRTLVGHTNKVYAVAFDGRRIISSSMDRTIRVWDFDTGRCVHLLEGTLLVCRENMHTRWRPFPGLTDCRGLFAIGHESLVGLMQLRGDTLVSGAADNSVRVWNVATGACVYNFESDRANAHIVRRGHVVLRAGRPTAAR